MPMTLVDLSSMGPRDIHSSVTKQRESSGKLPHLCSSVWFLGGSENFCSLKTTLVATGFNLKSYVINTCNCWKTRK